MTGRAKHVRVGTTIKAWWNVMLSERGNGRARYTRKRLESIAASGKRRRRSDRRHPLMKRIAANHILMMLK